MIVAHFPRREATDAQAALILRRAAEEGINIGNDYPGDDDPAVGKLARRMSASIQLTESAVLNVLRHPPINGWRRA